MRKSLLTLVVAVAITLAAAAPASAQDTNPISVLKSDASFKEKAEACRALVLKGDREAVPALAAMLGDEKLSHMARWALEPMPCPEAGQALREALGKTSGRLKMGIINSLAIRKDEQAVPALIKLLSDADAEVAQAAAESLGAIAAPDAAKALQDAIAQPNIPPGNLRAFCDGLFGSAEKLAEKGQRDQAIAIYDQLLKVPNAPKQVQAGALRGAVLTHGGEQGLPLLVAALRGDDENKFAAGLRISRELANEQALTAALAGVLPALPPEKKIRVLEVLGDRGGTAAGPAALAQAKEGPIEVRVAALRALARMSYSPALELMAQLAWTEEGEVAKAARNALSYFPGKDREASVKVMLENEHPEARGVAVELIGGGALDRPVGILMKVAETDADEHIRAAALRALQNCAGVEEMPALLDHLLSARSQPEMQAAEGALGSLCARQKRTPTGQAVGAPGAVVIQKALYGNLPDGPAADVTGKVKGIVESGSLSVDASNSNFGDPAPGVVKKLRVEYTENGTPLSKTIREGETLKLAITSAPPVIVDALCAALEKAQGEARLALLRLLGSTGSRKALEAVQTASAADQGPVKETAQRTLCEWPTPDALPSLMELVKTAPDPTLKVLALRGAVRLLAQSNVASAETLDQYAVLMNNAGTADEKKSVLGALAQMPHAGALELALGQFNDESVKAEAVQAAIAVAKNLGKSARDDSGFFNGKDLTGWQGNMKHWRFEDGAIVGHSDEEMPQSEFLWSGVEVRDFYLAVDVKLEPNSANAGVQFRSKKVDEHGQAQGYQADIGQDVWGRLYHEHGRGKLDGTDQAEKAVTPGQWNRYEILAVGPAIWTAINGKLGVAFLDLGEKGERSGLIAFQIHAGPPQTVRYRIERLVHDPKVELEGLTTEGLVAELRSRK
jgi:HEAT repeat protein